MYTSFSKRKEPLKSMMHLTHSFTRMLQYLIGSTALLLLPHFAISATEVVENTNKGWYQIETVIFTHDNKNNNEHWFHNNPISQTDTPIELIDPLAPKTAPNPLTSDNQSATPPPFEEFTYLNSREQKKLPALVKRLQRSKGYRVLFEGAWKQSLDDKDSLPIHVQGGESFNDMTELDGYLRLRVNRYLHITTNLQLTLFSEVPQKETALDNPMQSTGFQQPGWTSAPAWNKAVITPKYIPMENIIFKQTRRMRSKELHYLDNPRLGLLIYVTPLELPETKELTQKIN
jgi:hypothetical protein